MLAGWRIGALWRGRCGCHWATVHLPTRTDIVSPPAAFVLCCALHRAEPQGPS
jgi:hypothetical protein